MPQTKHKLERTITAVSDQGAEYEIDVFVQYKNVKDLSNTGDDWSPTGFILLRTTRGEPVTILGKGRYKIMLSRGSVVVTSDDPLAP